MKMILAALTTLVPGTASACERCATMGGGMMPHGGGCASGGCGHLAAVLMAATAALGYFVLHQSSKDSGSVRRAGQVAGWVLLVVGLGGFLCGAAGHARRMGGMIKQCHAKPEGMMGGMQMPPGHPPVDGMNTSVEVTVTKKKGK